MLVRDTRYEDSKLGDQLLVAEGENELSVDLSSLVSDVSRF
jgi:hypothetical protein